MAALHVDEALDAISSQAVLYNEDGAANRIAVGQVWALAAIAEALDRVAAAVEALYPPSTR